MHSNNTDESHLEEKWRRLCFRYIGRQRALDRFKAMNSPDVIIENQTRLVQEALLEMTGECLADKLFLAAWEKRGDP